MSLIAKLKKNTKSSFSSVLSESKFFNEKKLVPTPIPMVNVALSAYLDGGIGPGMTMIAGPSKHFKTCFSLLLAKAYLDAYPEAALLFYDSEFGSPQSYFENFGIDTDRVFHTPITDIEVLKNDLMNQLENIVRGDKLFIIVDSIGNLASKKEVEDALKGSTAADFSRAKSLKSFGRMVTSHLTLKDIPMIIINHTYKTMEMYSKDVVGGGTGLYLSSDNIWILGRQQNKNEKTKTIEGYDFVINVEKSRYLKEKSKIMISITYENGIDPQSGLFENALAGGFIKAAKQGWYLVGEDPVQKRKSDILESGFLMTLVEDDAFKEFVHNRYSLASGGTFEDIEEEVEDE